MNKVFKRIVIWMFAILVIFCISSCNKNNNNSSDLEPMGDISFDGTFDTSNLYSLNEDPVYGLASDCIAFDLSKNDFDVIPGVVIVGDYWITGLIYTNDTIYSNEDETIYEAGFYQLIDSSSTCEYTLTSEDVEKGIVASAIYGADDNTKYFVNINSNINSYSGIYNNKYFKYNQISPYAINILVTDNEKSVYDESIDLYSFDEGRFIFRGDFEATSIDAYSLYTNEELAYKRATDVYNNILEIQNNNGSDSKISSILVFSEESLNKYILSNQRGEINDILLSSIEGVELNENQYFDLTDGSVKIGSIEDQQSKDARLANGIIATVTGTLAIGGAVAVAVVTYGAGAPIAISTIFYVSAAMTAVYSVSNMIEGVQDIYYAANNDLLSPSINPVLQAFRMAIKDDKKATMAYHAWGISSGLIMAVANPTFAALKLPSSVGFIHTALNVSRAVVVEAVKIAITAGVGMVVNEFATEVTTELTDSVLAGKLVGYGSSMIAGMIVYGGLTKLDKKYNFSGLYEKQQIPSSSIKGLSKEKTIKKFQKSKWNKMSDAEKEKAILECEEIIAKELGIKNKPNINFVIEEENSRGYYTNFDNQVYINRRHLDNPDLIMETIAHELRHAQQYQNYSPGSEMYASLHKYIDPKVDYDGYYNQMCEVDARNYASAFLQSVAKLFK